MSEIKALEELRKLGEKVKNSCFTCVHCDAVIELADAIEAEIAERFMELPVDADSVPIHIGDELTDIDGELYNVSGVGEISYRSGVKTVIWVCESGNLMYRNTEYLRHMPRTVEPRTLEDVIYEIAVNSVEMSTYAADGVPRMLGINADYLRDGIEEHMDEIRDLLGTI